MLKSLRSNDLPLHLALPLEWMRHLPASNVFGLTVEKLFAVEATELERLFYEHQGRVPRGLDVPISLWAFTVAYVASRIVAFDGTEALNVVASQWCGTPVFTDGSSNPWNARAFETALRRSSKTATTSVEALSRWETFARLAAESM